MPAAIQNAPNAIRYASLLALASLCALLTPSQAGCQNAAVTPAGPELPTGVAPLPSNLARRLQELLRQTEERRGLRALRPVAAGVVDERLLRRQMVADLRRELPPDRLVAFTAALEAFGLIPRGMDLTHAYLDVLDRQVGGFYDPEQRYLALVSRGGALPGQERAGRGGPGSELAHRAEEMVLVHELTHALQDQHFSLDAFTDVDPLLDASSARTAVVEGDATLTMLDWLRNPRPVEPEAYPPMDIEALTAGAADMPGLAEAPAWMRDSLLFGYVEGYLFCASAQAHGGRALIDRAFTDDPPRSSEQILHPEKWHTRRDDPIAIPWPDLAPVLPAARQLAAGELGELGIRTLLRPVVERGIAAEAAAGWGGDRFVLYGQGRRRILVWITEWDSEDDAAQFAAAATHLKNGFLTERGGPRRVFVLHGKLKAAEHAALAARLNESAAGKSNEDAGKGRPDGAAAGGEEASSPPAGDS